MSTDQLRDDLQFVRSMAERSRPSRSPAAIYLVWAAISAIGFPLIDFAPDRVWLFWAIASPAGTALSFWIGSRSARAAGQIDRSEARRHLLHWGALLVVVFLASALLFTGRIPGQHFGEVVLLLVALAYFLAGVHLDRPLLAVALVMVAAYGMLFVLTSYAWTIVGLAIAAGLALTAVVTSRKGSH